MTISLTSPVTGTAQTNLTSPTYTVVVDQAPDVNAKQWYISALGGTQTGVRAHSAADPFTFSFWRDKVVKTLGQLGLNGQYTDVPVNKYKGITRKGIIVAANQPPRAMIIRTEIECPAGGESYDKANMQAALSEHFGSLSQLSAGIGDTVTAGSL
jgi:hypothetical protein